MYILYEYLDKAILHIPDSASWQIKLGSQFEDEGDGALYVTVNGEKTVLVEYDRLCSGRPSLPISAVYDLYSELLDVIAEKIERSPELKMINICAIEDELLKKKYIKLWAERDHIRISEKGYW